MKDKQDKQTKEVVNLTGVPETMLWTLHNRAAEARRPDGFLRDPDCVRIYDAIDYDYTRSFGKPDTSHPLRSRMFDDVVKPWIAAHPGGAVVELAAGLETQFQRVDDGHVRWYCVDLPEALAVRERFIPSSERCKYIPKSVLDFSWMDDVDGSQGVFVTAQGLFMYFEEEDVRRLVVDIAECFPGVDLMFDTIPTWFANKTMKGYDKTEHYRSPPMPWGVSRDDLEPLLSKWSPRIESVQPQNYGIVPRGLSGVVLKVFSITPGLRNFTPVIVHVKTKAVTA